MRGLFLISLKAKCREGSEKCQMGMEQVRLPQLAPAQRWALHRGVLQTTLQAKAAMNLHLEIHCALQVHAAVGLGELIAFLIGLQLEMPI